MERRNLYRILHVQPEAPVEVIKAAYRALMSTLRMHPDLGGDDAVAARLNAAYATLSDPASRRAYDLSLRRPGRSGGSARPPGAATPASTAAAAAASATSRSPATWLADRRCPFCSQGFTARPAANLRCGGCDSPLFAAPGSSAAGEAAELIGRRRSSRFDRRMQGWIRRRGEPGEHAVNLRDLSLSGASFHSPVALARGSAVRLITPLFDAVVHVVACRGSGGQQVVHAELLTLQLVRDGKGVFVSVKA